jgi:tetrahydrodipicolinate N-succinyltransferase
VIIETPIAIGALSKVAEGVVVGEGSVLAMGYFYFDQNHQSRQRSPLR